MAKKFYITTAIAYPNSTPHLGHALEIIQADVVARFHKLLGKDVHFQTGTDEHGVKNYETAQKAGKDILEFLDGNVAVFKKLYKELNIGYDYFIRTSDKKVHYPAATTLWNALVEKGDIYKKNYTGLYCAGCEAFKTEKELEEGQCPNHPTKKIQEVEEENYFFKLSEYKDQVSDLIEKDEYKVIPTTRKNEILSFLKEAKDISFSRPKTTLPWGIPVPGDDSQVMYVWCDALSNYITGVGYGNDEKEFKKFWPADVHIIGKDILRFHAGFWPAMLLSGGIEIPKQLFVHGFLLTKGAKMSKSTGNVIEPFEQIEKYGVDPFRFYLVGSMPIDSDGDYSEEVLLERINTELVGNVSNFCYRVLSFTNKNFKSKIGNISDEKIIKEIEKKTLIVEKAYKSFDFKKALEEILAISALGNKYFQDSEPWKLVKEDKEKAHAVIGTAVNLVKNLSILLQPIMPEFSQKLQKQLQLKDLFWKDIDFKLKNHEIGEAEILVNKMDDMAEETFPLDLRVAQIESVEDHPDADKLIVININLGNEKRQIVAGIKNHYSKEDLEGKKIIVVANLEPATLRGVESQAMLLAAVSPDESILEVVDADGKPGDVAQFEDLKNTAAQISFKEFQKQVDMHVKDGNVVSDGKKLQINGWDVVVKKAPGRSKVR